MDYTYTITPDDVYCFDWRKLIEGYEVVEFWPFNRSGKSDLFFLSTSGTIENCDGWGANSARLILRKKQLRKWMIEEVKPEEATRIRSLYLVFNPQTNDFGAYSFVTLKEDYDPDWIPVKVTEVTDAD